ncbi:MAG: polyketide cyclase / dehydrase and lipid transport family protein [Acidimicrobiales bacterium]
MQVHTFDFVVDGTPEEVWDIRWQRMRAGFTSDTVTIEVFHPGDDEGNGLVRHCTFPVPRYLLSGGRAQSWEWITEAKRPVSWRYDGVGKPLWSRASGTTRLEDLGGGRTRVHFRETYEVFNPVMRRLLERHVHDAISKDNDKLIEASLVRALAELHGAGSDPA